MEVGAALRSPVFLFQSSEHGSRSRSLPPCCANLLQLGQRGHVSYGSVKVLLILAPTCLRWNLKSLRFLFSLISYLLERLVIYDEFGLWFLPWKPLNQKILS